MLLTSYNVCRIASHHHENDPAPNVNNPKVEKPFPNRELPKVSAVFIRSSGPGTYHVFSQQRLKQIRY